MTFLVEMIRQTPPYVWAIFAILCWRASATFRTRWIRLRGLLILPAIFIVTGIAASSVQSPMDAAGWAVMAGVAGPVGFLTAPHPLQVDRTTGRLQVKGSAILATRLLVIFLIRYALAVAMAVHPDRHRELALATSLFSGLFAGYYVGWSTSLLRAYRRAPRVCADPCAEGMAPVP